MTIERTQAIRDFMVFHHNIDKQGQIFNCHAIVSRYGESIFDHNVQYQVCTNKYGQLEICITWDLDAEVGHTLGLYGSYTVKYQDFSFQDEVLTITDNDTIIKLY